MLAHAADSAIGFYQRYLSPYKGFCCAYRAHTGGHSCSAYARIINRRLGAFALLRAMPRQFARCRAAYEALTKDPARTKPRNRQNKKSRWYDNCDCSGCNAIDCDVPINAPCKSHHCELPCDLDIGACDCSL
ncbi:MAG: membrane protein insertion efficiency factor YidD [Methylococcales bacterium]